MHTKRKQTPTVIYSKGYNTPSQNMLQYDEEILTYLYLVQYIHLSDALSAIYYARCKNKATLVHQKLH